MPRADKTVKLLLGLIAFFLGILALQPVLKLTPSAEAQTDISAATSPYARLFYRTELVNRVVFSNEVLGVQVMDNTHCFLVWTKNSVEVYRVNMASIPQPTPTP